MSPRVSAVPPSFLGRTLYPKVTVAEYHEMINNGVFSEGDPVELLDGYLVTKMSRNAPHDSAVRRLGNRLPALLPAGWVSQGQCAITLPESEPEPDGAIMRGSEATFDHRKPEPSDLSVVIEVSDSSLLLDRREKGQIYARAGIPVYWVINVVDRQVEVYSDPDATANPPAYRARTDYHVGDQFPIALDGKVVGSIPVSELLP